MLFALVFDRWIWGTRFSVWSILGSSLILGSALYVAVKAGDTKVGKKGEEREGIKDEERGLIQGEDEEEEERGVQEVQPRTLRV